MIRDNEWIQTNKMNGSIIRLKWIKEYPNYSISDDGKVWSKNTEKYLILQTDKQGYKTVKLYKDGKSKRVKVHRLVAQQFIYNYADLPQVNHIDGNKANNYTGNLEWCTAAENTRHAYATGLASNKGKNKKLTMHQAVLIINRRHGGKTLEEIADEFGVSVSTIHRITTHQLQGYLR